jgi:polysaccharide biosynthesis/export protein
VGSLLRAIATIAMAITALLVSACSHSSSLPPGVAAPVARSADNLKPGASTPMDQYVIGSGDTLSVFVYRNADLSDASVAVRPDGRISVPLIEDITAAGKTPTQLAREIEKRLKMTLLDVLIATKGLTKYAAGNRAEIIRRDTDGKQTAIRVRLSDLIKDGDIDQNIEMQPGDTLIIPQSWF